MRHVQVLSLRPPWVWTDTYMFDTLSGFPAVQVLYVDLTCNGASELWIALRTQCPALREVHLQLPPQRIDSSAPLHNSMDRHELRRALAIRHAHHSDPLQSIHLYASPVNLRKSDLPAAEAWARSTHIDHVRDIVFHPEPMQEPTRHPPICSTPKGLWAWPVWDA